MAVLERGHILEPAASMKAPPKRKGNHMPQTCARRDKPSLNESPSEKEGKFAVSGIGDGETQASMKAPPKRKGNPSTEPYAAAPSKRLNESPSEKEGKSSSYPARSSGINPPQ